MKNLLSTVKRLANRRTFIRKGLVAFGAASTGSRLLARPEERSGSLSKGDASMRSDVKIMADPQPLRYYRLALEPVILNGCAASN